MTADRWTQGVRHQLGLGRLLPLGLPRDGAWITEEAAESALRRAAAAVDGVRLGALRVALADPDLTGTPAVPPPPSALPPGPLRVTAEFRASADPTSPGVEPLPATAARLRLTLAEAATQRLGLDVAEVDLRVTDLMEDDEQSAALPADDVREAPAAGPADDVRRAPAPKDPEEARIAATALAVPGVTRLTDALGQPVHIGTEPATEPALPRRHIRVELAVSADERAVDVARAVRTAITETAGDTPSVAVLVTAVSQDAGP
ncbi:nucleopolyhedrovirus P10 family protein [Streptomyces sp. NPDC002685]|uniref:nucleopolyhedrovirus P10 family protein n=1 Tax=Streptomyces sp. NPDC002685 TaxID=3154540 RepID=UPI00332AD249